MNYLPSDQSPETGKGAGQSRLTRQDHKLPVLLPYWQRKEVGVRTGQSVEDGTEMVVCSAHSTRSDWDGGRWVAFRTSGLRQKREAAGSQTQIMSPVETVRPLKGHYSF